jgi:preprotein translocase subunit SecG
VSFNTSDYNFITFMQKVNKMSLLLFLLIMLILYVVNTKSSYKQIKLVNGKMSIDHSHVRRVN